MNLGSFQSNFRLVDQQELPAHVWLEVQDSIRRWEHSPHHPRRDLAAPSTRAVISGPWAPVEKDFLRNNWGKLSEPQIAARLKRELGAVRSYATSMGLRK